MKTLTNTVSILSIILLLVAAIILKAEHNQFNDMGRRIKFIETLVSSRVFAEHPEARPDYLLSPLAAARSENESLKVKLESMRADKDHWKKLWEGAQTCWSPFGAAFILAPQPGSVNTFDLWDGADFRQPAQPGSASWEERQLKVPTLSFWFAGKSDLMGDRQRTNCGPENLVISTEHPPVIQFMHDHWQITLRK